MLKPSTGIFISVIIGWTHAALAGPAYDESPYYDINHYFSQTHPFDTSKPRGQGASSPRPQPQPQPKPQSTLGANVAPVQQAPWPAPPPGYYAAPPVQQAPWPAPPPGYYAAPPPAPAKTPWPVASPANSLAAEQPQSQPLSKEALSKEALSKEASSKAGIDEESGGVMVFEMANEDRGFFKKVFDPLFSSLENGNSSGQLTWAFRFAYTPNKKNPDWVQVIRPALFWIGDDALAQVNYALEAEAFTPHTWSKFFGREDRPHVGFLTLNSNIGLKGKIQNRFQRLDRVDLMAGVVGPASGMEQAHKGLHSLVGKNSKDWDQINSEPIINLHLESAVRYFVFDPGSSFNIEIMPHVGAALGNAFTYGGAGLTARFGGNLARDQGAPRQRYMLAGTNYPDPGKYFAWNFFGGVEARAHAHNITLDGNTMSKSKNTVSKERYTHDIQAGFEFGYGGYRAIVTNVYRSKEFRGDIIDDMMLRLSLSAEL